MLKLKFGYSIGPIKMSNLSALEFNLVKKLCRYVSREASVFRRVYHNNCLFHSVEYRDGEGKRNSTYCSFRSNNSEEMFGQIQTFVECPPLGTVVFIKRFSKTGSCILKSSGIPCREVLNSYVEILLISRFVIEVFSVSIVYI